MYSYLTKTRGLSPEVVNALIKAGLLYQDTRYGNAVFINSGHTYFEVRGTLSSIKLHRTYRSKGHASYWWLKSGNGNAQVAYVCESAIDAVSLYELHQMSNLQNTLSIYCTIGGVDNQQAIERIQCSGEHRVILAVDNDPAGDQCRALNLHFEALIPAKIDWNYVFMSLK